MFGWSTFKSNNTYPSFQLFNMIWWFDQRDILSSKFVESLGHFGAVLALSFVSISLDLTGRNKYYPFHQHVKLQALSQWLINMKRKIWPINVMHVRDIKLLGSTRASSSLNTLQPKRNRWDFSDGQNTPKSAQSLNNDCYLTSCKYWHGCVSIRINSRIMATLAWYIIISNVLDKKQ